jgi:hypothetical protein
MIGIRGNKSGIGAKVDKSQLLVEKNHLHLSAEGIKSNLRNL